MLRPYKNCERKIIESFSGTQSKNLPAGQDAQRAIFLNEQLGCGVYL
jgi:hypothetical protein